MAAVCKLVRDGSTLVDFQGGSTGFQLVSWQPKVSRLVDGEPMPVMETLTVTVAGTDQDNLANYLQSLAEAQRWTDAHSYDQRIDEPVWFHVQLNNETNERRAFVHSIEWGYDSGYYDERAVTAEAIVTVTIERGVWERSSDREFPKLAGEQTGAAIEYDYTAAGDQAAYDIHGDIPARIGEFGVGSDVDQAAIGRLWIGLRSETHGVPSNFQPIWECEDAAAGDLGTDATAETDGGNTSSPIGDTGDDYVLVSPGTTSWAKRLTMDMSDVVGSNYKDNFGSFNWLLRVKTTVDEWEVQLRYGYDGMADNDFVRGAILEFDTNNNYDVSNTGQQRIPFRNLQAIPLSQLNAGYDQHFQVQIWARRTGSAGNLWLDCISLVPIDEGFLYSEGFDLAAGADESFYITEGPSGEMAAMVYVPGTASFEHFCNFSADNFRLPPGDGEMVIVYAGKNSSDITNGIGIYSSSDGGGYYERWLSLRGSE